MLRFFDVVISLIGLIICSPILLLIYFIGLLDTGSPLFSQQRVGRNQQPFILIKFRTMHINTASIASHLADANAITAFGRFLRGSKLDELPQLWNVLKGQMSLVGPRPCLFNQEELILERAKRSIFDVRPGITGLAQINKIDMSTPQLLAETDERMLKDMNLIIYFKYIIMTVAGRGLGDVVKSK